MNITVQSVKKFVAKIKNFIINRFNLYWLNKREGGNMDSAEINAEKRFG